MFQTPDIRPDCRHYNGYKPCGYCESCLDCKSYEEAGTRILIIKLGAAGDVIRTTPLLAPLRERESPCYITWITDPVSVDLLRQTRNINRLMAWSWENCMVLQGRQFDLLMNFDKESRAMALADLVQASRKIGFAPAPHGGTSVYNEESLYALRLGLSDELKFRQNTQSATEIVFGMAGLPYKGEEYEIGLTEDALSLSDQIRADLVNFPVVGLNTGCGEAFQTKQWTFEGFAQLAEELNGSGCRVLLMGGPREKEFNDRLKQRLGPRIIDTGCDNTIEQFMGIVNACDLLVTADTMALHIAIGLKKRVVAMFGPTCHQEIDLFGRGEKIITDFACSPCYRKTCEKNPTCMTAMDSSTVAKAAMRQVALLFELQKRP